MASQTVFAGFEETTADERTLAFLAHLLMAFTGFIGPLVIFCVKQDSRFVKFHSLQALIWQAIYVVLGFVGMAMFLGVMFSSLLHNPQPPHSQGPPTGVRASSSVCVAGFHGRLGGKSDIGSVVCDQGPPGRVGDVPDFREMAATRDSFREVKLPRRRKSIVGTGEPLDWGCL